VPHFVAVVDYGRGNLRSVAKALESVGIRVKITQAPADIEDASALVVPGQGAFGDCMQTLEEQGLLSAIERAIRKGKPYLGICIGLQILYAESEEYGRLQGLGIIDGRVVRFKENTANNGKNQLKIPHMGWNQVRQEKIDAPLWAGIPDESFFYFVHSYYGIPDDPRQAAGWTEYGTTFTAAVYRDNLFAVQFHPEKSQGLGLALLKNFGKWAGKEVFTS